MIASGRTDFARSGMISGSGFASARISGFGAIFGSHSGFSTLAAESPRKMSASVSNSGSVRASVCCA
jgi:hypothetical protein